MIIDLSKRVLDELNSKLGKANEEFIAPQQFHRIFESSLQKCGLVTREEFEVQKAILLRTREKVEALEEKLKQLESSSSK